MGDLLKISVLKISLILFFLLFFSLTVRAQEISRIMDEADVEVLFSDNLLIEKGWSKYVNIQIENTGNVKLDNVKISVEGTNSKWFEFQDNEIGSIKIGEEAEVIGKVFVPYETASGNYKLNLIIETSELSYEDEFNVNVFSNRDDMLLYELQGFSEEINDIERGIEKVSYANLTFARDLIYEARSDIRIAEQQIKDGSHVQATETMRDIEKLLIKIRFEVANPTPVEETTRAIDIPLEFIIIFAAIITTAAAVVSLIYLTRKIKIRNKVRLPNLKIKEVILENRKSQEIEKQIDKIVESQKLLEEEYRNGIISKESFDELKLKYQEKLLDLETLKRKLRGY